MSDLTVAMEALSTGAAHIRAASAVADQVHGQGSSLESRCTAAGQQDAASGLAHFFDRWSYGAGHLHTDADELAKALQQVIDTLRSVDNQMAQALQDGSKAPAQPGGR